MEALGCAKAKSVGLFAIVINIHSTATLRTRNNGSLKRDKINHFFFIDFNCISLYKGFIIH